MPISQGFENRPIKGILFDMDNTLFDLVEAKLAACDAMVDHIGIGDPKDMFSYFHRGTYDFEHLANIRDYLNDIEQTSEKLYAKCCQIYERTKLENIHLYPGVEDTFRQIREMGLCLVVVTDAHNDGAISRLEQTGISGLVDQLVTCDMTGAKKPAPEFFHYALDMVRLKPPQAVFVGDSLRRDIAPAKKIGMLTAYAAYGDRNDHEERSVVADHVLESINDVLTILQDHIEQ